MAHLVKQSHRAPAVTERVPVDDSLPGWLAWRERRKGRARASA